MSEALELLEEALDELANLTECLRSVVQVMRHERFIAEVEALGCKKVSTD